MLSLTPLESAILRTLLYADIFDFPLTEAELHHFLIGYAVDLQTLRVALRNSERLAVYIEECDGFWTLRGRAATISVRCRREAASQVLLPTAYFYGKLIAYLPFVRMVALTGALAMHNARHARDDIDYLIVTAPNRVWLARLLAVVVVRLARLRGVQLCPNYVLSETALAQEQHDLYMAHELAQMIPLAGQALYTAMRVENSWTSTFLPNAVSPFHAAAESVPCGLGLALKKLAEFALRGKLGDWLEHWERRRKQRKLMAQHGGQGAAKLDAEHVKGHFQDHGAWIRAEYARRLSVYALSELAISG
ncbi:MAG: hypothetical protein RML95_09790 [Anaerolineae bacterium]|nr:hypothetical protein [Anaerolineae bacterium]